MRVLLLRKLWRHLSSKRQLQIGALLFLMLIVSLSEALSMGAVMPFLTALISPEKIFDNHFFQPVINFLEITNAGELLLPMTALFVIAVIFSNTLKIILVIAQSRLSYAIGSDLSVEIYRRSLYEPYSIHISRNSSEVMAMAFDKANSVVHNTISPILIIANTLLMLIVIMAVLIVINGLIAISVLLSCSIIYAAVILITKKKIKKTGESISAGHAKTIKILQEGLGGIRDVLIDGTQSIYCDVYSKADVLFKRAQANIHILGAVPRFVVELIGMIGMAGFAYSLAVNSDNSVEQIIPVIGVLALGAQRLLPVLQQAYASWANILGGYASFKDVVSFLDSSNIYMPKESTSKISLMPFNRNIEIHDLSYRYASQLPLVISKLNLSIVKGERIGFIGKTGSGKSTLLDLLMGLLEPTEGYLSIDGVKVIGQNNREWQARIAHVPQSIFLADATIAENIALGVPWNEIDFHRLKEVSEKAKIASTIEGWRHSYATPVGERGVMLSGGQRQRIGIARALYKMADVIILDEATSALDNETEKAVIEAIESLGQEVTVIVVAHRVTTLKNCTRVVELLSGKIARIGSYAEIIGENV